MFAIPEHLVKAQKAELEKFSALTGTAFNTFEQLVELNMTAAKATLEDATGKAETVLNIKDPQSAFAYFSGLAQPNAEKTASYVRHVADIMGSAQAEYTKFAQAHVASTQAQMNAFVDQLGSQAPAGTEGMFAMFKSSMAAAQNATEAAQKVAKQMADQMQDGAQSAWSTVTKAANDGAKPTRRKAA